MADDRPYQLADGIVRLGSPMVNWYLVADEGGVTVVDTGLQGFADQLEPGLELLGRSPADVKAVILTHADGDHTGVAPKVRDETGAPIHLHPSAAESARNRGRKDTDSNPLGGLRHPTAWRLLWHFGTNGGFVPPVVDGTTPVTPGTKLQVPGEPLAIDTPGHAPGHVAFLFAAHGALFCGDLLCTWHPQTGARGPQLMAFNTSTRQCLESLPRIEDVDAALLLPGHGEPWTEGPAAAVARAREAAKSDSRL